MACAQCGESRFTNRAQRLCHGYRNHAKFTCGCEKKFFTEEELDHHHKDQEKNAAGKRHACDKCCRSFKEKKHLNDHKLDKDHWSPGEKARVRADTGRSYCDCGKSFKTPQGLHSHKMDKPSLAKHHPCYRCADTFKTSDRLAQHQKDTGHLSTHIKTTKDARQLYMISFHNKYAAVTKDDRKASVATVKGVLDQIMKNVRDQKGGKVFSSDLVKAGSHAVKTKIGKADEFDWNVPLNTRDAQVRDRGPLLYKFDNPNGETPKHMKADLKLVDMPNSKYQIPNGYAAVSVPEGCVPKEWTHNGDIIPSYLQRDLYHKIDAAIKDLNLDKRGVSVSRKAHGPAVTVTIQQPRRHNINVDIVPCIPSNLPVTSNCWPRPDTRKALSDLQIKNIMDVGTHLVPKGDIVFNVSYSKAEKELLKSLDAGNGCRKQCHQVMKRLVQEFASKSPDGAPGISSHLFKHQLFNMNEKNPSSDYWHQRNFGERVVDMMKDAERVLRSGKLPNYFNTGDNLLAGKDRTVLNRLADYIRTEREKLLQ